MRIGGLFIAKSHQHWYYRVCEGRLAQRSPPDTANSCQSVVPRLLPVYSALCACNAQGS